MKDHEAFDVDKNRYCGQENWDLDTFIRDAAERAIEGGTSVDRNLGCFSTDQLARYCRHGYHKTQKTEQKVREELMNRIEIGDVVIFADYDVVRQLPPVNAPMPCIGEVDKRNKKMIHIKCGGWYSKNYICWAEADMFPKKEGANNVL